MDVKSNSVSATHFTGLLKVNFFVKPVGLSPRNFTEPDRKTASPEKKIDNTQIMCVGLAGSLKKGLHI